MTCTDARHPARPTGGEESVVVFSRFGLLALFDRLSLFYLLKPVNRLG